MPYDNRIYKFDPHVLIPWDSGSKGHGGRCVLRSWKISDHWNLTCLYLDCFLNILGMWFSFFYLKRIFLRQHGFLADVPRTKGYVLNEFEDFSTWPKMQSLSISSPWIVIFHMVNFIVVNLIMRVLKIVLFALVGLFRYPILTRFVSM